MYDLISLKSSFRTVLASFYISVLENAENISSAPVHRDSKRCSWALSLNKSNALDHEMFYVNLSLA